MILWGAACDVGFCCWIFWDPKNDEKVGWILDCLLMLPTMAGRLRFHASTVGPLQVWVPDAWMYSAMWDSLGTRFSSKIF